MKAETRETVRTILIQKMSDILGVAYDTVDRMSKGSNSFPDPLDRAMSESLNCGKETGRESCFGRYATHSRGLRTVLTESVRCVRRISQNRD